MLWLITRLKPQILNTLFFRIARGKYCHIFANRCLDCMPTISVYRKVYKSHKIPLSSQIFPMICQLSHKRSIKWMIELGRQNLVGAGLKHVSQRCLSGIFRFKAVQKRCRWKANLVFNILLYNICSNLFSLFKDQNI